MNTSELDFVFRRYFSTMKTYIDGNNNIQLRCVPSNTIRYSVLEMDWIYSCTE